VNPLCTANPPPAGCPTAGTIVPTFGTNFHTSYMPVVADGLYRHAVVRGRPNTGRANVVCDIGNGGCEPGGQQTPVDPSQVALDPTKALHTSRFCRAMRATISRPATLSADCAKGVLFAHGSCLLRPTAWAALRSASLRRP